MDALIGLNREEKKFQIKPWDKTEKAKHIPEHKHIYNKKTDWVLTYVTCFGPANQTEQSRSCIRNNSILMSNPYFVGSSQRKWSSPTESLIHTLHYHSELKWLTKTWLLWLWTMALVCARPVLQGTMLLVQCFLQSSVAQDIRVWWLVWVRKTRMSAMKLRASEVFWLWDISWNLAL